MNSIEFKHTPESAVAVEPVTAASGAGHASAVKSGLADSANMVLGLPLRALDFLLLIASVAVADFFLYWEAGATGYALAVLLWTLSFWASAEEKRLAPNVIVLLFGTILLCFSCVYSAGFWNVILPLFFLFALAVLTRSRHVHTLDALILAGFSLSMSPFRLLGQATFAARVVSMKKRSFAEGIVRYTLPALAALVLFLFFGWIFSKANPVIAEWAGWFFDKIEWLIRKLIPSIDRLFLWGCIACVAAGLIKPLLPKTPAFQKETQKEIASESPWRNILALTAVFSLVGTIIPFALNNLADVIYLWMKAELPAGITYSQYAREGAGWLTVALFLSTVLIGFASTEFLIGDARRKAVGVLSWIWIALDVIMAAGALRRLQIYIGYNGLTPLRITGIVGTLIVTAGLGAMAVKLLMRRNFFWIVRRYVSIFLIGISVYAVFPEEWLCSKVNTRWVMNGNSSVLVWLFEYRSFDFSNSVGAEGLPELAPLIDHPDTVIARGVSTYIARELEVIDNRAKNRGWRGYQIADARALNMLATVRPRLVSDDAAFEELRQRVWQYR